MREEKIPGACNDAQISKTTSDIGSPWLSVQDGKFPNEAYAKSNWLWDTKGQSDKHDMEMLVAYQAKALKNLALSLAEAESRERGRLAAVLHDDMQQLLVAAKIQVGRIVRVESEAEQRAIADKASGLIQQALTLGRTLTSELRPVILFEVGFSAAIEWLADHTKTQYEVEVATFLDPKAEPEAEGMKIFLYGAVRELIFNAVKHAGAGEIRVITAIHQPGRINICVADDGAGCDHDVLKAKQDAGECSGLQLLLERAAALEGRMYFESKPRMGTRVHLELPLI
jgi:signal transduction histidine kinase